MGIMYRTSQVGGMPAPVAAAETVVFTTPVITAGVAVSGAPVAIKGFINLTPGVAATSVTVRVRQGGLTSSPVVIAGLPQSAVAAGAAISIPFAVTDVTGYLQGGGVYSVSVQQNAATGNGVMNLLDLEVSD